MTNEVKQCIEILTNAIAFEEEGISFFTEQAKTAGSSLERNIFESLAKDEEGHKSHLVKLRDELSEASDLSALQSGTEPVHRKAREIFETALASAQDPYQAVPEDLEILQGAMEVEKKGYAMYAGAAAKLDSKSAKALFTHLAQEEQNHFRLLSNAHDYLSSPESWSGYDDGAMLDGG